MLGIVKYFGILLAESAFPFQIDKNGNARDGSFEAVAEKL